MSKSKAFGLIILGVIAVLVGLPILQSIASSVGILSSTFTTRNTTIVSPVNGEFLDLTGQDIITEIEVTNTTEAGALDATNYSIAEGVSSSTGLKTIRYQNLDDRWDGLNINVSYTYGSDGYIDSGAGRNIALLIVIFGAIGIVIVVMGIVFRSDLMRLMGR